MFLFASGFDLDLQKETETVASFYSDGAHIAWTYVSSHANLVDGRLAL